jgi:hypothetical protein
MIRPAVDFGVEFARLVTWGLTRGDAELGTTKDRPLLRGIS